MMRRKFFICLGLVFATVAVYWHLGESDFTNFDDREYVAANPHINRGLTASSVAWAFKSIVVGNWHPVTLFSHMLDCQLFGVNPHAHHLINLLLHVLNTLLLFHLLQKMTRELWPSAVVAALFALHPLHVESVAWIAERKDVLSTFFGLLAIWAYLRYVKSGRQNSKIKVQNYLLALVFFALGLMSKPMLVTWPFVLLLLDFWPLERTRNAERGTRNWVKLILEKVPFFALTIASSIITFLVQRHAGAVIATELLPPSERIFNAVISFARYLEKTFWPAHLAVFYPLPAAWPAWQVAGAALLLIVVSGFVVWQIHRRPFLAVGWFWFLGTLIPVIGLVQVGSQSMADRYSYIPLIGIFVMLVWGAKEIFCNLPKFFPALAASAVLIACAAATFFQVQHWKNSETLFRHALAVTDYNSTAHLNLGAALLKAGNIEESLGHFERVIALNPNYAEAYYKIAHALEMQGKPREAFDHYQEALRRNPNLHEALNNFALLLATCPDDSIRNGNKAVRLGERACELTRYEKPACISTLAAAYAEAGRFDDAIRTSEKARELAIENGEKNLAELNSKFLEMFRSGHSVYQAIYQ